MPPPNRKPIIMMKGKSFKEPSFSRSQSIFATASNSSIPSSSSIPLPVTVASTDQDDWKTDSNESNNTYKEIKDKDIIIPRSALKITVEKVSANEPVSIDFTSSNLQSASLMKSTDIVSRRITPDTGINILKAAVMGQSKQLSRYIDFHGIHRVQSVITSTGVNVLHAACQSNQVDIIHLLCDKGCDIDKVDRNGTTALHFGVLYNHPGIIEVLLNRGASVELRNDENLTPFLLAVTLHRKRMMTLLRLRNPSRTELPEALNIAVSSNKRGLRNFVESLT